MAEAVKGVQFCSWPAEVERLELELAGLEALLAFNPPCDVARLAVLRQRQRELTAWVEQLKASVMAREVV
jgi:hypothetical protein